jgi:hypothetical protein
MDTTERLALLGLPVGGILRNRIQYAGKTVYPRLPIHSHNAHSLGSIGVVDRSFLQPERMSSVGIRRSVNHSHRRPEYIEPTKESPNLKRLVGISQPTHPKSFRFFLGEFDIS